MYYNVIERMEEEKDIALHYEVNNCRAGTHCRQTEVGRKRAQLASDGGPCDSAEVKGRFMGTKSEALVIDAVREAGASRLRCMGVAKYVLRGPLPQSNNDLQAPLTSNAIYTDPYN